MRWEFAEESYRPIGPDPNRDLTIISNPDNQEWVWTGASDGSLTVGWLLRNFSYRDKPEKWIDTVTACQAPTVQITGLDNVDLQLVWFDDHLGTIVGGPIDYLEGHFGTIQAAAPANFGKSMAFLIQPKGFTPKKYFPELPNEMIVQIDVSSPYDGIIRWHAERPRVRVNRDLTFTAKLKIKPDSLKQSSLYTFDWKVDDVLQGSHADSVLYIWDSAKDNARVEVVVRDLEGNEVSGDILIPRVMP